WVTKTLESSELISPAFRNRGGQVRTEIAKEQERRSSSELLSHKQQGRLGREQQDRHTRPHRCFVCHTGNPISESAIADLIMILQKRNECRKRQLAAWFSSLLSTSE